MARAMDRTAAGRARRSQTRRAARHSHRRGIGGTTAGLDRKRRLSVKLWRIAAETREYAATDLTGAGAAKRPGRWNDYQEAIVYCAPTIAMAVLETAAHVDDSGLPLNRYLVEIDVPDVIWARHEAADVATLPPTWGSIPAGRASAKFGSDWL